MWVQPGDIYLHRAHVRKKKIGLEDQWLQSENENLIDDGQAVSVCAVSFLQFTTDGSMT